MRYLLPIALLFLISCADKSAETLKDFDAFLKTQEEGEARYNFQEICIVYDTAFYEDSATGEFIQTVVPITTFLVRNEQSKTTFNEDGSILFHVGREKKNEVGEVVGFSYFNITFMKEGEAFKITSIKREDDGYTYSKNEDCWM